MSAAKKIIVILLALSLAGQQLAQAAITDEDMLLSQIQQQTKQTVSRKYYSDFDRDGESELFAVTGGKWGPNQIWFASSQEVKRVYHDHLAVYSGWGGVCQLEDGQRMLIQETGGFGSGSRSVCYYVREGRANTVKHAGQQLTQLEGNDFAVFPGAFDNFCTEGLWTGHTWKKYYIRWNGSRFVEYAGRRISVGRLKKYRGAKKYLKQVKKLGFKVTTVFYRENGIINVNLRMKSKKYDNVLCENITLAVQDDKVSLVVCDKKGRDIVDQSSYGGIYRARGF